jgi:hypothetical protein
MDVPRNRQIAYCDHYLMLTRAVIREMYELLPHSDEPLPPIETNLTSQQCKHLIQWIKPGTNLATLSHSDLFAIRRFADKFDLQALDSAIVNVFTTKCVGSSTWGIFVDALREDDEVVARAAMAIMGERWFFPAKYRELDWSKMNYKTEVKVRDSKTDALGRGAQS